MYKFPIAEFFHTKKNAQQQLHRFKTKLFKILGLFLDKVKKVKLVVM